MASQSEYLRRHKEATRALHAHQERMKREGNRDASDPTYQRLNRAADDTAKQLKGWRKLFA
jgi:hypothetical protein